MRSQRIIQQLGILLAVLVAGCHPPASSLPRPLVTHPSDEIDRLTLHQAGKVLAGTAIQHTFRLRNPTDWTIELAQPDGVQASCGCARATVADEKLAPGQSTSIAVHVRTEGREGNLSEVVQTTWQDGKENRIAFAFAIRAIVVNGLVLTPRDLTFAKQEVAQAVVKRVTCTSDLPVDWNTATVVAEADYLEVTDHEPLSNGDGLRFNVACHPAGSGVSRQDHVLVHAEGIRPNLRPAITFSVRLPVYSVDPAPLRVAPAVAILRPSPDGAPWTGTLFVTGDAIADGARIDRIRSADARITFRASTIAACAVRLDLHYWPTHDSVDLRTQVLELSFTTGETQRTTIRLDDYPKLVLRHK